MSKDVISCFGSCGELFQCVVGNQEYLMSYHITKKSTVRIGSSAAYSLSKDYWKIKKALNLILGNSDIVGIHLSSDIPLAKGFSSSSADIIATLQAASLSFGKFLSPLELTKLSASIEPTDSIAFDKWTVINPLTGQVIYQTNWTPDLYVYILEPKTQLVTTDLERMSYCKNYPSTKSSHLFDDFVAACKEKNIVKIGQIASRSAVYNNRRLPKPFLKELLTLVQSLQLLGINVAHSGTAVGILMTPAQLGQLRILESLLAKTAMGHYYNRRYLSPICYRGVFKEV